MKKAISVLLVLLVVAVGATAFMGMNNREDIKQALEEDDYDAWRDAMQENINEENFERMKQGRQRRFKMHENRESVIAAIESGDYEAWKAATEEMPRMSEKITEESFPLLVEMHEAMQEGDVERADELRDELGMPGRMHGGMGKIRGGCGMR